MAEIKVGKFELDPAKNPAVLDTATWRPEEAWNGLKKVEDSYWTALIDKGPFSVDGGRGEPPAHAGVTVYRGSHAGCCGDDSYLAELPDGQHVFIRLGAHAVPGPLGTPLGTRELGGGRKLSAYPTDMNTLAAYLREVNPEKRPRAWGAVPRMGIGDRHTTAIWPAAFSAMEKKGFAANAIQNSLRELNLLDDLKAAKPAHENYLFSFGTIAEGHAGSTFEGLLHRGVLEALKAPSLPRYGADADHIQVKRGPEGLERAKRVITAARHYSFFTLDVSDVLGYLALKAGDAEAAGFLDQNLARPGLKRDVLLYHRRPRGLAGSSYAFSEADIGRYVGKYWRALDALEALYRHLLGLKGEEPFDMELSIDENPPEVTTWDSVTQPGELVFLAAELARRRLPITHVAPNFGVEKGVDYRCPDGLEGLEKRTRIISRIAEESNFMLDCHSGDDLKKPTRIVFGRATRGRINFKISPELQIMFAETLFDVQRDTFMLWWKDVQAFVEGEAGKGSSFAQKCMAEYEAKPEPRPDNGLFHYYCFVSVGRREPASRFALRERLYELGPAFLAEYRRRLEEWFCEIADDVYGGAK